PAPPILRITVERRSYSLPKVEGPDCLVAIASVPESIWDLLYRSATMRPPLLASPYPPSSWRQTAFGDTESQSRWSSLVVKTLHPPRSPRPSSAAASPPPRSIVIP